MSTGELYWSIVEQVWDDISIYDGPHVFKKQFYSVPEVPRTLFAGHWFRSEVCNGGLLQFFSNSTGVLCPEALLAYRKLHMPKLAEVVANAMQWFGADYPRERSERQASLDAYRANHPEQPNPFEALDEQFFELIDSENEGFDAAADAYAAQSVR